MIFEEWSGAMDFRRVISGRRGFGAGPIIVVLLAFGLGSAILLWSALDRLLLRPLPVAHPETLVRAVERHAWVVNRNDFPFSTYEAVRRMHGLAEAAVEGEVDAAVRVGDVAQPALAHMVSGNYFAMLGVTAEAGRTLEPADDEAHTGSVPVVLAHRFWVKDFGGSRAILGSTLVLQGRPFVVVGVLPGSFFGTSIDSSPDVWLPLSAQPLLSSKPLSDPEPDIMFSILGRLRPGTTLGKAQAEFAGIYRGLQPGEGITNPLNEGTLEPIGRGAFALHDSFARALSLLAWGLAALLLMMCANVAALLLAEGMRRERDTAVRLALGAGRVHLTLRSLRQAAVLGVAGGAGGLLVAWCCAPLLLRLLPASRTPLPVSLEPGVGAGIFALSLALLLSLVFGGVPAWLSARVAPERALRRGTATRRRGVLSRGLLLVQTGLTLVLLAETGLLLRTFSVLRHTNPGFDREHLICFTLDPGMAGTAAPPPATLPFVLQDQVRQLPGVRDASLATAALMRRIGLKTSVALPGMKILTQEFLNTSVDSVSVTFFDTMNMPIVEGRGFAGQDARSAKPEPVVVNEAFARKFFPHEDPVGKTFGTGRTGSIATGEDAVIGVVGDSKYRSLREELLPIYYTPIQQRQDWGGPIYLYVRTEGTPGAMIDEVRGTLARLDAQLPFYEVVTMEKEIEDSLWQERMLAVLGTVFSVLSMLMATVGLYGLLAFDTNQRTREFGIRSAVGAQKRDVAFLLVRDLARIVIPGVLVGIVGCMLLSRWVAFALYGVRPLDPGVLSGAVLMTVMIAMLASWSPVRRATRVDPAIVLRDE
jgi:predicted permease